DLTPRQIRYYEKREQIQNIIDRVREGENS
ncbi:hypothetical protein RCH97_03475, partial [Staphylococcus aureus]|nr:hypothetical protein [Staphylococcus aureus]